MIIMRHMFGAVGEVCAGANRFDYCPPHVFSVVKMLFKAGEMTVWIFKLE